jgi:uncharacterized membrane protein
MSHRSTERHRPGRPGGHSGAAWVLVALLLAIGIVVPLLVFIYDKEEPTLIGFPFYYWFQFLTIPIVSLLTFTAFKIAQAAERRERQRVGLPADPATREGER